MKEVVEGVEVAVGQGKLEVDLEPTNVIDVMSCNNFISGCLGGIKSRASSPAMERGGVQEGLEHTVEPGVGEATSLATLPPTLAVECGSKRSLNRTRFPSTRSMIGVICIHLSYGPIKELGANGKATDF